MNKDPQLLPLLSQITLFAGYFPPIDWMFCHGQILPIRGNEALFSLIGTSYGGDGKTNFALPDLRTKATNQVVDDRFASINYIICVNGYYPKRPD